MLMSKLRNRRRTNQLDSNDEQTIECTNTDIQMNGQAQDPYSENDTDVNDITLCDQVKHIRLKNDLNQYYKLKIDSEGCSSVITKIINQETEVNRL